MKKTAFLMMAIALVTLTSCDANFWEGMANVLNDVNTASQQQNMYNSYLYNAASYQPVSRSSSHVSSSTSSSHRTCSRCRGTASCQTCGGSGKKYDYGTKSLVTHEKYVQRCGVCRGTGRCGVCDGKGSI